MTGRGLLQADSDAAAQPTAAIYLRVSTKEQAARGGEAKGFSIPGQRQACYRKVEDLGASAVAEFVDRGESAKSADRPEVRRSATNHAGPDALLRAMVVSGSVTSFITEFSPAHERRNSDLRSRTSDRS